MFLVEIEGVFFFSWLRRRQAKPRRFSSRIQTEMRHARDERRGGTPGGEEGPGKNVVSDAKTCEDFAKIWQVKARGSSGLSGPPGAQDAAPPSAGPAGPSILAVRGPEDVAKPPPTPPPKERQKGTSLLELSPRRLAKMG